MAGFRHWVESQPERSLFRVLVGERDGRIAAFGMAGLHTTTSTPDVGWSWAGVREAERRRGLGSALFAQGEAHLRESGARKLESITTQGTAGEAFLERRGYRRARVELKQTLDLGRLAARELDEAIERRAHEGFALAPLSDLRDRRRDVHAVYAAASADVPADDPEDDIRFDEWEVEDLGDPELTWDGSFVVLHGDRPVALAFVLVNWEARVAVNSMTGTVRDYRGRGLARLAKLATIRWAKEHGVETIYTANDSENAPMLALNRSLGYEVRWRGLSFSKSAERS